MHRFTRTGAAAILVVAALSLSGCGKRPEALGPPETFHWVAQPISFSPPPERWRREGDNGGGMLGVRFVLTGGGGQCLSVLADRQLDERDRSGAIRALLARGQALAKREFLDSLSLARPRTDDPISDREAEAARNTSAAIDRAESDYLSGHPGFVASDLDEALRAASAWVPTLQELLPRMRLRPDRMQEPDRWRIGYEHDTTLAGVPAFASEDTLLTPERPLLYREFFWVVHGSAFKAIYQGTPENLETFARVVASIQFPEEAHVARE
jgi:hypothetical protein